MTPVESAISTMAEAARTIEQLQAQNAALLAALNRLLGKVITIEVCGEYEAMEVNRGELRKMRAGIEIVLDECRAAIALAEGEK